MVNNKNKTWVMTTNNKRNINQALPPLGINQEMKIFQVTLKKTWECYDHIILISYHI
jgi:hypothetical protein